MNTHQKLLTVQKLLNELLADTSIIAAVEQSEFLGAVNTYHATSGIEGALDCLSDAMDTFEKHEGITPTEYNTASGLSDVDMKAWHERRVL